MISFTTLLAHTRQNLPQSAKRALRPMPKRKKVAEEKGYTPQSDYLVEMLKRKFFALIKTEKYPKTPEVTDELDFLQGTIRELERENA